MVENRFYAAILSFFVFGLGQYYNGEGGKAILIAIVEVYYLCNLMLSGSQVYGLLVVTWFYSVIDAYSNAKD
jgi:TM2 domain-containing membrane protein YozV